MSVTMYIGLGQSTLTTNVTPLFGSQGAPCGAILDTVTFAAPMNRWWFWSTNPPCASGSVTGRYSLAATCTIELAFIAPQLKFSC